MDLGPLTMFSLVTCVILNFVSREHWRNTAGRDRFASLFSYFCSSHSWAHTFSPDIFSASGSCNAGGASSPAPAVPCSLSGQPLQQCWLSRGRPLTCSLILQCAVFTTSSSICLEVLHQGTCCETLSYEWLFLASWRVNFQKISLATFLPSSKWAMATPSPTSYKSSICWGVGGSSLIFLFQPER